MIKSKILGLLTALTAILSASGFCAFNMTLDNDFTIKIIDENRVFSSSYVVLPGEQVCSMKGLTPGKKVHFYIYTRVDYGDWIKEYGKDIDANTDVKLFMRGADENWSLLTQ